MASSASSTGSTVRPNGITIATPAHFGGKENADEGFKRFLAFAQRQVREYLHRLQVAGLDDREDRMDPVMRMMPAS